MTAPRVDRDALARGRAEMAIAPRCEVHDRLQRRSALGWYCPDCQVPTYTPAERATMQRWIDREGQKLLSALGTFQEIAARATFETGRLALFARMNRRRGA